MDIYNLEGEVVAEVYRHGGLELGDRLVEISLSCSVEEVDVACHSPTGYACQLGDPTLEHPVLRRLGRKDSRQKSTELELSDQ